MVAVAGEVKNARISVIMGIIMLGAWIMPLAGLPLGGGGMILAISARHGRRKDLVRAGLFLNGLGLLLTIMNLSVGIYLFAVRGLSPNIFF